MENSHVEINEINKPPVVEQLKKAPVDAVVVCGMGPVKLHDISSRSDRLYPLQPYNRLNAIAAKLLASNGVVDKIITSGTRTAKFKEQELTELEKRELETSEGELLADTYDRARGKGVSIEGRQKAAQIIEIDTAAKTTFDNIFQALNILDAKSRGYWQGNFAVLSAQFHAPRIKEMLKAFGIKNSRVLSAENVLRDFGYSGKLYPTQDFGYGKSYEEFEEDVYKSQPAGLENLQDNPAYVTFELEKIRSDKRLQEIASNLRDYYTQKGIPLPQVYNQIPSQYDEQFDYNVLRIGFSQIPFSKHGYNGQEYKENVGTNRYRELASAIGQETDELLKSK